EPHTFPVYNIESKASARDQNEAVSGLLRRLVPQWESKIMLHVFPGSTEDRRDLFVIETFDDKISITGTSGVAVATGLYYYLKRYCAVHVSWSGIQTKTATGSPPLVTSPIRVTLNDRFRYYQNVCTASYSMVWWNWTRWEQEIDWMALSGINLPLAFNGQEEIWRRTFLKLGLSQAEIDPFFSGPAFLAWQRMGNFRGFGGPLPESWHQQQVALQHKILKRMRDFGMTPVLPAFSGHVPRAMERLFPNVTMTRTCWQNFSERYACPTFVYPNETLFVTIGRTFLEEYIQEFGTDHIYNTDLFNELNPPSPELEFLRDSGKAVYSGLTAADPKAVWVMQSWLFVNEFYFWTRERIEALLTSVPQGRMVVLDLDSDLHPDFKNTSMYFGQPFIWNMLLNFGGVLSLYGSLDAVNTGPQNARNANHSTMIGTGLTPEGIFQNDMMFEFMNENAWRFSVDIDQWVLNYVLRRYGAHNVNASSALLRLRRSVYNLKPVMDIKDHGRCALIERPQLHIVRKIWYDPRDVYHAWDSLLGAANDPRIAEMETYRYDLVDVTRQSLQLLIEDAYESVVNSFKNKSMALLRKSAETMRNMIVDLDKVLGSDSHFLLGKWLEDAKRWGSTPEESTLYEYNARNQITLWGPQGEIVDYANKQWSGLIRGYYLPRWELFFKTLEECLATHTSFNNEQFKKDVFSSVEEPFTFDSDLYPAIPEGDSISISVQLFKKYHDFM
ncbi:unnamed protein product, partial [Ixodes hexagonus]